MRWFANALVALALVASGCSDDGSVLPDTGIPDLQSPDIGVDQAIPDMATDGPQPDTVSPDTVPPDLTIDQPVTDTTVDTLSPDQTVDTMQGVCQGQPDGTACGSSVNTACNLADTCQGGVCVANLVAAGTACGDPTNDDCTNPDTCDGVGNCLNNHAASGTACGDPTVNQCTGADTCNGSGLCLNNHASAGTACGDPTSNACTSPDSCNGAGACLDNHASAGTACGDPTNDACTNPDSCNGSGSCLANHASAGSACGDPTSNACTSPDTCNGSGACLDNHASAGAACGDPTSNACTGADSCNGAGACLDNHASAGTACGDPTSNACTAPDSCDGSGACLANHASLGTSCGDPTSNECTAPDSCDGSGGCLSNHVSSGTACGDPTSDACTAPDSCDGSGTCLANHATAGTACGSSTSTTCDAADSCSGTGVCNSNFVTVGTFCADCQRGPGLCDNCDGSGLCEDSALCPDPTPSSVTTFYSGSLISEGSQFDVLARSDLRILGFQVHPATDTTIEIYMKVGTHVGSEKTAAAWTLIGQADVSASTYGTPTVVPVSMDIVIPLGQSVAFYVTSTVTGIPLFESLGESVGMTVIDDGNLLIRTGTGLDYPFGGSGGTLAQPRVWNGTILYSTQVSNVSSFTSPDTVNDGTMFDVVANSNMKIMGFRTSLPVGSHNLELWYRPGTHVGFENDSGAWVPLDSATVTSTGGNTYFPITSGGIIVEGGKTAAFYLTTQGASSINLINGTSIGALLESDGNLALLQGTALKYPFGTTASGAFGWLGTVYRDSCP